MTCFFSRIRAFIAAKSFFLFVVLLSNFFIDLVVPNHYTSRPFIGEQLLMISLTCFAMDNAMKRTFQPSNLKRKRSSFRLAAIKMVKLRRRRRVVPVYQEYVIEVVILSIKGVKT